MKGNLFTENFVEIIIAVIGIVLIGVAVWHVYQVTVNSEMTSAKRMMDSLEGKITALKVGEEGVFTFQSPCTGKGTCEWFLTGWDLTTAERPDACYFKPCVCACKGDYLKPASVCASVTLCRTFDITSLTFPSPLQEIVVSGVGPGSGAIPKTVSVPVIQLTSQLNVLKVNRTSAGIEVRRG